MSKSDGPGGRSARPSWAPLRAAGRSFGLAFARVFTGGRRRTSTGKRHRARPIASISSAFLPDHEVQERAGDLSASNGLFLSSSQEHEETTVAPASFPLLSIYNERPQGLLAVGHKQWGNWWDGRGLLKVRIYDFALYADSEQVQEVALRAEQPAQVEPGASPAASQPQGLSLCCRASCTSPGALFQHINRSQQVAMALKLRAARNLPLWMLAQEFDQVLKRRSEKVGGSKHDPAIKEVVEYFSKLRLPSNALAGDAVRNGSVITFTRTREGRLITSADGVTLGQVQSPKLCEALFDLYLGDQPVSQRAKAAGEDTLWRMVTDGRQLYKPAGKERVECDPQSPDRLDSCVLLLDP